MESKHEYRHTNIGILLTNSRRNWKHTISEPPNEGNMPSCDTLVSADSFHHFIGWLSPIIHDLASGTYLAIWASFFQSFPNQKSPPMSQWTEGTCLSINFTLKYGKISLHPGNVGTGSRGSFHRELPTYDQWKCSGS